MLFDSSRGSAADNSDSLLPEMERLSGVELTVRVQLDQITLTVAQLMDLNVGSVVRLTRPTGENLDIYVEEVLLGWGEVLLTNGAMSLRLADLCLPVADAQASDEVDAEAAPVERNEHNA